MWLQRPIKFGVLVVAGLALIAAAFAAGLGISQTFATHSDPDEHHACVSRYTGQMRYVADPASCTPYENPITWNGADPADLDTTDAFYEVRENNPGTWVGLNLRDSATIPGQNSDNVVEIACNDADDVAIAGGYFIRDGVWVTKNQQKPGDASRWHFDLEKDDGSAEDFHSFSVTCQTVETPVP